MKAYDGTELRQENGKWYDEEGTEYQECYECGDYFPTDEMTDTINGMVCEDCLDNYSYCDRCGGFHPCDDVYEVYDTSRHAYSDWMCQDCAEDTATYCDCCGSYYRDGVFYVNSGRHWVGRNLCEDCRVQEGINCCERCDAVGDNVQYDDCEDEYLCDNCYHPVINCYGKTKNLPYFGEPNDLHMGIELEIDEGGKNSDNARTLMNILGEDTAECKEDASLDDGFEIASAPATYEAHKNELNWKAMMDNAVALDYLSHNTTTCGLHIHVDRAYFINTLSDTDCENKFALLFGNNADWIKRFSRRADFRYCEIEDQACQKTTPQDAKKGDLKSKPNKYARYVAINYNTGINTIEFRIFRGTLKYTTFLATLQFVQMFCDFVNDLCVESLAYVGLFRFMQEAKTRGYNEFLTYLKERGLLD